MMVVVGVIDVMMMMMITMIQINKILHWVGINQEPSVFTKTKRPPNNLSLVSGHKGGKPFVIAEAGEEPM